MQNRKDITVIIPIFNAFEEALECAKSVFAHTPSDFKVLFLDDGSTDGRFEEALLARFGTSKRFKVIRHPKNIGFVKSVNVGFKETGKDDVVLLNSDTLVTPRWIEKLSAAAYSRPKVGTVTPLSNNATICSFPWIGKENEIPEGYSLKEFARLVEHVSEKAYPILPTCVGFCVYIRRELLDTVGCFDEVAFGRGYGEENDLSLRGQSQGFLDILDDQTYIYHRGGSSFGTLGATLKVTNSATLIQKHPHYLENVGKFIDYIKTSKIHRNIFNELVYRWSKNRNGNILHILHNGPYDEKFHGLGGTEKLLQRVIEKLPNYAHWSMVPHAGGFEIIAHMPGVNRSFLRFFSNSSYHEVIKKEFFDVVHVHHTEGFNKPDLVNAVKSHGKYFVSIHDHHYVCPRIFMLTPEFKLCSGRECTSACNINEDIVTDSRSASRKLLEGARSVFHFSDTSKELMKYLDHGKVRWHKLPHGRKKRSMPNCVGKLTKNEPIKILLLGSLMRHKGSLEAAQAAEITTLSSGQKVEWHLVGSIDVPLPSHVHQHGSYNENSLSKKLNKIRPHLALFLSLAPESYSLTVEETLAHGIPVIVPPVGAPQERILQNKAGWVLQDYSFKEIERVISLAIDPTTLSKVSQAAYKASSVTEESEHRIYTKSYQSLSGANRSDVREYLHFQELYVPKHQIKTTSFYQKLKMVKNSFRTGAALHT